MTDWDEVNRLASAGDWPAYFRAVKAGTEKPIKASEIPTPRPEHISTSPWPDGFAVPSVVEKLMSHAQALGWATRPAQYARGYVRGQKGPRLAHSVGVRMDRGTWWAVAVYESPVRKPLEWTATTCVIGGPFGRVRLPGVTPLREFLEMDPGTDVAGWAARVLADHAEKVAAQKVDAKMKAGERRKIGTRKRGEMS